MWINSFDFKWKNNVKSKRLWVQQIFMERYSKGEFHVLVKKLKLFDHEFFLKHILHDVLIFHSDASQSSFYLIICCIQTFHWLIIFSNNFFRFGVEFFSTPKWKKKIPVQGKEIIVFLVSALAQIKNFPVRWKVSEVNSCLYYSKRENRQFVRINLLVVNLLNGKLYWPNVCQYGFKTQSLTCTSHCRPQNVQPARISLKTWNWKKNFFLRFTKVL